MSVASRSALAAVALIVLFTIANAQQEQCTPSTYGRVTDNKVQLSDIILPAGQERFNVNLPDACKSGSPVGSTVSACDKRVAPGVSHKDLFNAVVVRADFSEAGRVHSYVYCS